LTAFVLIIQGIKDKANTGTEAKIDFAEALLQRKGAKAAMGKSKEKILSDQLFRAGR